MNFSAVAVANRYFYYLEAILACLFSASIVGLIFSDFLMRELGMGGLVWAKEVGAYLMIWVGFIGASLATYKRTHIEVGFADRLYPKPLKKTVSRISALFTAFVSGFLSYLGWIYVMESREFQEASLTTNVPLWLVQIIIPLSLAAMSLRFLGFALASQVSEIGSAEPGETNS